jgi:hypothetical protein
LNWFYEPNYKFESIAFFAHKKAGVILGGGFLIKLKKIAGIFWNIFFLIFDRLYKKLELLIKFPRK